MKELTVALACLIFASAASAQNYTVQSGDTVRAISFSQLGTVEKWQEICDLNAGVIATCDFIRPGMVLAMPGTDMTGDVTMSDEIVDTETEELATETTQEMDEVTGDSMPATDLARRLTGADLAGALATRSEDFTISPMGIGAKISGALEQANPGGHPGIFVALGKSFETAASGNTVKVTVTIEAEGPGRVGAAYSTSDVGNSGWQYMQIEEGENSLIFNYAVPELKNGGDDYVGVLPDPDATGQVLTLTAIEAEVISQ